MRLFHQHALAVHDIHASGQAAGGREADAGEGVDCALRRRTFAAHGSDRGSLHSAIDIDIVRRHRGRHVLPALKHICIITLHLGRGDGSAVSHILRGIKLAVKIIERLIRVKREDSIHRNIPGRHYFRQIVPPRKRITHLLGLFGQSDSIALTQRILSIRLTVYNEVKVCCRAASEATSVAAALGAGTSMPVRRERRIPVSGTL